MKRACACVRIRETSTPKNERHQHRCFSFSGVLVQYLVGIFPLVGGFLRIQADKFWRENDQLLSSKSRSRKKTTSDEHPAADADRDHVVCSSHKPIGPQQHPVIYVVANPVRDPLDRKNIRGTSINTKLRREHENKTKTRQKERNDNTKHMPERK